jgi:hypothetical protein|nr:MAG TPA: hypothetical protein [Caudoviricetes sp.]
MKITVRVVGTVRVEKQLVYNLDENRDILEQVIELKEEDIIQDDFEHCIEKGIIDNAEVISDLEYEILETNEKRC